MYALMLNIDLIEGCVVAITALRSRIAQADDPIMAAKFIEERNALVASGQRPHRVTEFWLVLVTGRWDSTCRITPQVGA